MLIIEVVPEIAIIVSAAVSVSARSFLALGQSLPGLFKLTDSLA